MLVDGSISASRLSVIDRSVRTTTRPISEVEAINAWAHCGGA